MTAQCDSGFDEVLTTLAHAACGESGTLGLVGRCPADAGQGMVTADLPPKARRSSRSKGMELGLSRVLQWAWRVERCK